MKSLSASDLDQPPLYMAAEQEIIKMSIDSPQPFGFDQIIGESRAMRETISMARKVAASEVSCVLLQGESGVGKDCLAKAVHHASRRAQNPFVAINCAALP